MATVFISVTPYQLSVDIKDQLTVASSSWQHQPMVAKDLVKREFSDRLNLACDKAEVRRHGRAVDIQLALKKRGIDPSTTAIGKWLNGGSIPEPENLRPLAEWLNVRAEWLEYGVEPMERNRLIDLVEQHALEDVRSGPPIRGSVPLISWIQAGEWCDAIDNYQPGDGEEMIPCPFEHGPHAFCLTVTGPSMDPDYRDGEIILVDPAVEPRHDDDVVARTPDGKATFKRLQVTPEGTYLMALNPDWKPRIIEIPEDTHICGVVTGSWMRRRK